MARHGAALTSDPRLVGALLRDPTGEARLEISHIEVASAEGIATAIRDLPAGQISAGDAARLARHARYPGRN